MSINFGIRGFIDSILNALRQEQGLLFLSSALDVWIQGTSNQPSLNYSFQSGRLPVHVQLSLTQPCQPRGGMPQNMTGIAQHLKKGGYATHFVGKVPVIELISLILQYYIEKQSWMKCIYIFKSCQPCTKFYSFNDYCLAVLSKHNSLVFCLLSAKATGICILVNTYSEMFR